MFWHSFKYNFLTVIRDKQQIFWSMIFVFILGTLFYSTFGTAYEKSDLVKNIKVAAYIEDEFVAENFSGIIEEISLDEEGGEKLLNVTHCDSFEVAEAYLDDGDVVGVFYSEDGELKLLVKNKGIAESILSTIVSQYHQIITVMTDVASESKDVQAMVMLRLMGQADENTEKVLSNGNMDVFIQYFYNLIAMSCLFAGFSGCSFAIKNQANLSSLGARKNLGGSNSLAQTAGGLSAVWLVLTGLTLISFLYLSIIGVNFGNRIGAIILVIFVGCLLGVTSGYFIGTLSKLSQTMKETLCVTIYLVFCFLSGLMIMDMRMFVDIYAPFVNKINPAVMISDAFYALNVYETYDRFFGNIIAMLVLSVAFMIGGSIIGRRKQYASL